MFPIYLIGSFPKPSYLKIPSWFDTVSNENCCYINNYNKHKPNHLRLNQAFDEIVKQQLQCQVDVLTDGEIDRENYIWYHCRYLLNGFDFQNPKQKVLRNGACTTTVPVITGKITAKCDVSTEQYLCAKWKNLQKSTKQPIKVQIPGPMTIYDTSLDEYYKENSTMEQCLIDLSNAINEEVIRLCENGIKYIQIDEPLFARHPEVAKRIGFKCIENCFKQTNEFPNVYKSIHICCGYPEYVNQSDYLKANNHSYVKLAKYGLDELENINGISIEDAHHRVPIEFFKLMKRKDLIIGSVKVAITNDNYNSKQIADRITQIINQGNVKANKILLAPDCGLAMLALKDVKLKLRELKLAQNLLRKRYSLQSKL